MGFVHRNFESRTARAVPLTEQFVVGYSGVTNARRSYVITKVLVPKKRYEIKFEATGTVREVSYQQLVQNSIKDVNAPNVYGGVSLNKQMPLYNVWFSMLARAQFNKVAVDNRFASFKLFLNWAETQKYEDGWLLTRAKSSTPIYSPETCYFAPPIISSFLKIKPTMGFFKKKDKFGVCIAMHRGHRKYIGTYDTAEEAQQIYKRLKEAYIKELAEQWRGRIDDRLYQYMINYEMVLLCAT